VNKQESKWVTRLIKVSINDQVYSLKKQTTTNNYKDRQTEDI